MTTRRFISSNAVSGVQPIWFYGGGQGAFARLGDRNPGGIGDMILLGDGSLVFRNADAFAFNPPNIYETFGIGGTGQTYATSDSVVMPPNGGTPPSFGNWSLTWGSSTTTSLAYNASASAVASAINLLPPIISAGGVTVGGPAGGPYIITFVNNGSRALFLSGLNTLGQTASSNYMGVVDIQQTQAGSPSAPNVQTVTLAICDARAMGIIIGASGQANPKLLGTFMSSAQEDSRQQLLTTIGGVGQYSSLATSIAPVEIAGGSSIFCAGAFQNYYRQTVGTPMANLALIDSATGLPHAGFSGGTLAFTSGAGSRPAPRVFSDGATHFGLHSPGSGWGYNGDNTTQIFTYTYTFGSAWSPTGLGTLVSQTKNPIMSYRGTGLNGPTLINVDGSIGTNFACQRFSIAPPASKGGGVFVHDSLVIRSSSDLSSSTPGVSLSRSGSALTITLNGTDGLTLLLFGGSTGQFVSSAFNGSAEVSAVSSVFPDCSMTSNSSSVLSGTRTTTIVLALPSGATYTPQIASWFNGAGTLQLLGVHSSDGLTNDYYPAPFTSPANTTAPTTALQFSSAIAYASGQIAHITAWNDGSNNGQWTLRLPGVGQFNIALNYPIGSTTQNRLNWNNLNANLAVSIVPFKSGFALALPQDPGSNSGVPREYAFTPAKAGGTTTLLKSPIIIIDGLGNPDTAFDATLYSNFWSLSRTDSSRFGPLSLLVKGGDLYFGSIYIPGYLNASLGSRQISSLGDLFQPPTWSPFFAGGSDLEVLCACDTAGNKIKPIAYP